MPYPNPNEQKKVPAPTPPPSYPKPGDQGSRTQTWRTPDAPVRDFGKGGIQWMPPTYTEHSLTTAPLGGAPVTGAAMTPTFAQNDRTPIAADVYNPNTPLMQDAANPLGFPSPTPIATPKPKTGFDFFKSLFGLA